MTAPRRIPPALPADVPALRIFADDEAGSPASEFVTWDEGRLKVHAAFAPLLRRCGLTTFEDVYHLPLESVARRVGERVTGRIVLADESGPQAFFLKRHGPPRWREYWKAWARLTQPVLGARAEWQAMLWFQELRIPAPLPVILGESEGRSLTLATAIEPHTRLDHWWEDPAADAVWRDPLVRRHWLNKLAAVVRHLHASGLHHQDLYLCHLLLTPARPSELTVIDLGRVQRQPRLARRWRVKDLAQLHFSSPQATLTERLRFLRAYLGRRLIRSDRTWIRQIHGKAARIARHTNRHGL